MTELTRLLSVLIDILVECMLERSNLSPIEINYIEVVHAF
jgi:hypothetical protein